MSRLHGDNMDISKIKKVALCGKANSGKNTTAKLLSNVILEKKEPHTDYEIARHTNYDVAMFAFADPIKEIVMTMFPWADKECLYGASKLRSNIIPNAFDKEGVPLTYRQALIDLGTQGRQYNPNHWVDLFNYRLKNAPQRIYDCSDMILDYIDRKLIICTDVRFKNEFVYLKSKDFFIIKIIRNSDVIINHKTETEQDLIDIKDFDFVLDNNGTLDDLNKNVSTVVSLLK